MRAPDQETVQKISALLCDAGKRLLHSGLVSGTWGNLSHRVNDDWMIITPSGRDYELLTPEQMVLVNINEPIAPANQEDLKPSAESGLHALIYKNRNEIQAIIHTHSPNASTVAASRREVPPLLDDMTQIIGPSVRVAEYALPSMKKLAKCALKALTGRFAVLLANHGAVCLGRDMDEAFVVCEILEKSCRTFIESEFLGGAIPINPIEARLMREYYLRKYSKLKRSDK